MITTHVSASGEDYFDIEFSTDKEEYEEKDELTTTLKVTNSSEVHDAKDVNLKTTLPEELEVIGDDIHVKNGEIIWDVDSINHGESTELTFKTKLKTDDKSKETEDEETSTGSAGKGDDETGNGTSEQDEKNVTAQSDELSAPQTGDESSILKYILILVISTIVGVTTFLIIRKKRLGFILPFILAFTLLTPMWTAQAETGQDTHRFTESHQVSIGNKSYEFSTTITSNLQDYREEVPVTGTAYNDSKQLLTNETITFSTTVNEETVEETVETDDEGYFVARLLSNTSYDVNGNNLEVSVEALDENKIELTNQVGEIELGKSLTNGDNRTDLQPSVIYLNDKETAKIAKIADDLSSVTFNQQVDIQTGDLIVIPEWEDYIAGLSFEVKSVTNKNGQSVLEVIEPEMEDVFAGIVGDLDADLTAANFDPAPGIEVSEESDVPSMRSFSSKSSKTEISGSDNLKLTLKDKDLPFSGSIYLKGGVEGEIDWKKGFSLKPVNEFDVLFTGEQRVDLKTKSGVKKEKVIPAGKAVIPTQIPLISITLPADLKVSVEGDVSVTVSAGAKEEIGFAYSKGEGVRTYPEEHFTPFFSVSDIMGKVSASAALEQSLDINATVITLAGATVSAGPEVALSSSVIGNNGFFSCGDISATFDTELGLKIPLAKWELDGLLEKSVPIYSKSIGDCISSIKVSPDEMELTPGETKSFNVYGVAEKGEEKINKEKELSFDVSSNQVEVKKHGDRIDVKALDGVQDGEEITVKAVYEGKKEKLTDTLEVNIVDDREKGKLVGEVVDAVESSAIENASIKVISDNEKVTDIETDSEGKYEVGLLPGSYKLEVSSSGYITDTTRVNIESTETTTYDSKLQLVGDEYGGEGTASGMIKDAVTDQGVAEVTIDIRKGKNNKTGEVIQTITTDNKGNYSVDLPGGNYSMELNAEGYISAHTNLLSIGGKETGGQNATISLDAEVGDGYRVVLTWGESPRDLDSHITGPKDDEGRFHVYYSRKNYKDESNEVSLDRDDISSYGPETVTVLKQIQDGTYTYSVHNFTGRSLTDNNKHDLSKSNAKVEVYQNQTLLATYNVPTDQEGNSWRVLEVKDGQIIPVNRIETIDGWNSPDYFAPEE